MSWQNNPHTSVSLSSDGDLCVRWVQPGARLDVEIGPDGVHWCAMRETGKIGKGTPVHESTDRGAGTAAAWPGLLAIIATFYPDGTVENI